MKPRDFLNFFKTKSGKLITFAAVFAVALIIFSVMRKRHTAPEDTISVTPLATKNVGDRPQVVQSVVRPMQAFHPPPAKSQPSSSGLAASTNSSPQPLPVVPVPLGCCGRNRRFGLCFYFSYRTIISTTSISRVG